MEGKKRGENAESGKIINEIVRWMEAVMKCAKLD